MSKITIKRTIKIRPSVIRKVRLTRRVRKLSSTPIIGYRKISRFIILRVRSK